MSRGRGQMDNVSIQPRLHNYWVLRSTRRARKVSGLQGGWYPKDRERKREKTGREKGMGRGVGRREDGKMSRHTHHTHTHPRDDLPARPLFSSRRFEEGQKNTHGYPVLAIRPHNHRPHNAGETEETRHCRYGTCSCFLGRYLTFRSIRSWKFSRKWPKSAV